mmetsp:Transcript_4235/g.8034  ORF Transcript_4235/g.8034 Transcript_4235/m.8034 type:complete len:310 (+) Transcript_4235:2-931(+)
MPAGHGHAVAQMVNLELKLNMLLNRSEAQFKAQLFEAALRAADHFDRGEAKSAARALLYAASVTRQTVEQDSNLQKAVDEKLWGSIRTILKHFRLPSTQEQEEQICESCQHHNIEGLVARGDWRKLLCELVRLLEKAIAIALRDGEEEDRRCMQGTPYSQGAASPCAHAMSPSQGSGLFAQASPSVCSGLFVSTPIPERHTTPLRPRGLQELATPSQPTSSMPTPGSGIDSEEEDNSVASSGKGQEEDCDENEEVGDLQGDLHPHTVNTYGGEVFLACAVLLVVFVGCAVSAGLLAVIGFLPALPVMEA